MTRESGAEVLSLAADVRSRLNGKPHRGYRGFEAALHPGFGWVNSNTVNRLQPFSADAGIGPRLRTYTRDGYTGLDYANQRMYASSYGRFTTVDPAGMKSVALKRPASWNRYAYSSQDPVDRNDPTGECDWNAFGASAFAASGGAVSVAVATGVTIETGGIGAAFGTAAVVVSGTAATITGIAGMIGACTGYSQEQLTMMTNSANPGGAVSIAFVNIFGAPGAANSAQAAAVGALVFDAASGAYALNDSIAKMAQGSSTASDLWSYASAVTTALGDVMSMTDLKPGLNFVYTSPVDVHDQAGYVSYDRSEVDDELLDN